MERFEKKWNGGDDGLFVTEPMGTEEQKNKVKDFLSSALTEQLEELERWVQKPEVASGVMIDQRDRRWVDLADLLSHIREQKEEIKKV